MQLKHILSLAVILAIITSTARKIEAHRLKLRPLSAPEVYRILKEAGQEDAVPEGRVVTQGLAAMTGFTLGVTTGISGALLYDLATANATTEFINNFNVTGFMADVQALNVTAVTERLKGGGGTNTTSGTTIFTTQEICFKSRSLKFGEQGRSAADDEEYKESGRQTSTGTTPTTTTTPTGPTNPTTTSPTTSVTPTATTTGTTSSPTTTGTTSGTGSVSSPTTTSGTSAPISSGTSGTGTNTGTNSGTNSNTITDTGSSSGQTCIVIQKPKTRRRRSSHRKRH